jgi:hypothetical protein
VHAQADVHPECDAAGGEKLGRENGANPRLTITVAG